MTYFIFIAPCVVFLLVMLLLHQKTYGYWKIKGVPHRKPIILFGNFLELAFSSKNIGRHIVSLCDEFDSPYIGFYGFLRPFLIIKDPNLIKKVLIRDFHAFTNRSFLCDEEIDPIISTSLMGIKSPQWECLRAKWNKILSRSTIEMMVCMKESTNNLESFLKRNLDKNLEMKDVVARYAIDVISKCAFGHEVNSFTEHYSEINTYANFIIPTSGLQLCKTISFIFMPSLAKIFKWACVNRDSVTFFRKIFSTTELSRNQIDPEHFLAQIKKFETDEDVFKLYGDRLLAQALTFVVAGHTAISTIFAFTLHELAINVHMQERLREEIVENMNHFGDVTFESLQRMPYMHMLLQETLRKYPFTPFIHRECSEDYVFSETGLKIDKGTGIIIPQHALFWDRNHFPNPEVYDPERFSIENKHKINHSVYVPFGDGPRNCVGQRFAMICMKIGLISVIKNFKVERNSKTTEPMIYNRAPALQAKYGVNLTVTKLIK